MKILVDSREQLPFAFADYPDVEVVPGALPTGDYSLPGYEDIIAVERKSLEDLTGSFTSGRERFESEMRRARRLWHFAVIIEASLQEISQGLYRSRVKPKSIRNTVASWRVRFGAHFVFCQTRQGAEYETYQTFLQFLNHVHGEAKRADGKKSARGVF